MYRLNNVNVWLNRVCDMWGRLECQWQWKYILFSDICRYILCMFFGVWGINNCKILVEKWHIKASEWGGEDCWLKRNASATLAKCKLCMPHIHTAHTWWKWKWNWELKRSDDINMFTVCLCIHCACVAYGILIRILWCIRLVSISMILINCWFQTYVPRETYTSCSDQMEINRKEKNTIEKNLINAVGIRTWKSTKKG